MNALAIDRDAWTAAGANMKETIALSMVTRSIELGPYPEVGIAQGDFEDRWPGLYGGYRWERTVSDFGVLAVRQVTIRVIPFGDESAASELTVFVRPRPS